MSPVLYGMRPACHNFTGTSACGEHRIDFEDALLDDLNKKNCPLMLVWRKTLNHVGSLVLPLDNSHDENLNNFWSRIRDLKNSV